MIVRTAFTKVEVHLDSDGYPTVFRTHLKGMSGADQRSPSSDDKMSICNSDTTELYDEPAVFDEHGFPIIASAPQSFAETLADIANTPVAVVDPRPAARKRESITKRKCMKDLNKKTTAQGVSKNKLETTAGAPKGSDDVLSEPRLSGPTNEANPRCELVAKHIVNGHPKRVHVFTLTNNGFGADFHDVAKRVYNAIQGGGVNKEAAIQMREAARK